MNICGRLRRCCRRSWCTGWCATRQERIAWFADYGVRECWIVQQLARQVEVISFGNRAIAGRRVYAADEGISSTVLPGLNVSPGRLLSE